MKTALLALVTILMLLPLSIKASDTSNKVQKDYIDSIVDAKVNKIIIEKGLQSEEEPRKKIKVSTAFSLIFFTFLVIGGVILIVKDYSEGNNIRASLVVVLLILLFLVSIFILPQYFQFVTSLS